jgi:hypothetical protein
MSAAAPAVRRLVVERVAGLLRYEDGLARQAALAAQRVAGLGADTLLLCEVRLGSTRGTSDFRWLRDTLRRKRRPALTLKPPPPPPCAAPARLHARQARHVAQRAGHAAGAGCARRGGAPDAARW